MRVRETFFEPKVPCEVPPVTTWVAPSVLAGLILSVLFFEVLCRLEGFPTGRKWSSDKCTCGPVMEFVSTLQEFAIDPTTIVDDLESQRFDTPGLDLLHVVAVPMLPEPFDLSSDKAVSKVCGGGSYDDGNEVADSLKKPGGTHLFRGNDLDCRLLDPH